LYFLPLPQWQGSFRPILVAIISILQLEMEKTGMSEALLTDVRFHRFFFAYDRDLARQARVRSLPEGRRRPILNIGGIHVLACALSTATNSFVGTLLNCCRHTGRSNGRVDEWRIESYGTAGGDLLQCSTNTGAVH
jgi:hypothetical protein